jgi:hypothetical protein
MAMDHLRDARAPALDALKKIGTPSAVVEPLEGLLSTEERIRSQQFKVEKERLEIEVAREAAVESVMRGEARLLEEIEAEKKQELAAIKDPDPVPARLLSQTDSEYSSVVMRRSIETQLHTQELLSAVLDTQTIAAIDNPEEIAQIAMAALETWKSPAAISRVARSAEARLMKLAAVALRKGTGDVKASAAWAQVQDAARKWRTAEAERSPAGRRLRVQARAEQRAHQVRTSVQQAAKSFGLEQTLNRAASLARLQKLADGNR